jgi:hypothetical protein
MKSISHWFHSFVAWWRGYTADQLKLAFQIFLAFCIVMAIASPYPVWTALSYGTITPPLALVFVVLLAPQHQGGATLSAIFLAIGILLGGGLALAVKYITYFANGSVWDDQTVVKGVVYAIFTALSGGILNGLRWQWEITNQLFLLACAGLILSGGVGTYYSPTLLPASILYVLLLTTMSSVVTLVCCWFIFPVTAGSKYRDLVAKALDFTAEGISAYETLILGPVDAKTGRLTAAIGKIDPCTGTDEGLTPLIDEVRVNLRAARKTLFISRALHLPVRLEVDVYNTPKRFPYIEFMHSKIELSLIIATVATLTRPVKSGRINLKLFQQPELRKRFSHLLTCLKTQLHLFAGAAQGQKKWVEVDLALEKLDCAWMSFLDEAVMAVDGCTNPDAAFGLRGTSAFFYLVGSRTRSLYAALAGAVNKQDPEAVAIAIKRMEITPGWVKSADAYRNPLRTRQAALAAMQKAAQRVDNEFIINLGFLNKDKLRRKSIKMGTEAENKSISKALATQKSFSKLIADAHALGSSPTRRTRRVYNIPLPVIFGFQYAVALGIAIALCVVPVISEKGFHNRPTDVAITVAVTWQPNIGSVHNRSINRILGTALAAVWAYILLPLTFAATGGDWDNNNPGKFIVAGILAAIWAGFCIANTLRYPAKAYGWLIAGITVPLVELTLLRTGTSPPWDSVAFRLLNVCMGVCIVWIVSFTVFPLSARTMVNANFSAALSSMAELLRQLPLHLTPAEVIDGGASGELSPMAPAPSSPRSPFGSAIPIAGTNAFRQAFLAPIHTVPIRLAFRIQRALGDVSLAIPVLESEYLPLQHLHRVPQGATATAVHAAQLLLDFLNITFALKMENSHLGPWQIPVLQHRHMLAVASSVALALDSLRDVVMGDVQSIKTTLKCLDDVETGIARQIQETLAITRSASSAGVATSPSIPDEKKEKQALQNTESNRPVQVQQEVLVLLYMGISVSQQLKILCSATARAFLAQDEAVVAEIDRKALEFENELENLSKRNSEDASLQSAGKIESRAPGLEYLMARVLESSHGAWPISRAASSFSGGDNSGAIQLPEQSSDLNEVVTSAI